MSVLQQNPRPFDVLPVDDSSRLARNPGEIVRFTEEMTFLGIRVVAVSQGIDTQSDQAEVLMP
jgi:DNA invertase Pin-like site-specific DNA recombinase